MPEGKLSVLSIEDQADIQTILRYSLEATGKIALSCALNAADGIRMANDEQPDLIIVDYSLPDMDGPELMDRLKEQSSTRNIPIIMLTAKTGDIDREDCIRRGAIEILIKPFSPIEIGPQILQIYQSSEERDG